MEVNGFNYCCGASELGNFGVQGATAALVRDAIQNADEGFSQSNSYIMATTISEQKDAIRALKAVGFKPLARFRNTNTNARVTLWGLERSRMRKPKSSV